MRLELALGRRPQQALNFLLEEFKKEHKQSFQSQKFDTGHCFQTTRLEYTSSLCKELSIISVVSVLHKGLYVCCVILWSNSAC